MSDWQISQYFLDYRLAKIVGVFPWPIDEFCIFFLQLTEEFHDILPWSTDEFCNFFPWSTDEFHDFFWWLNDEFINFSQQLINKFCVLFLLLIGNFCIFFLWRIAETRWFCFTWLIDKLMVTIGKFQDFSLQLTREVFLMWSRDEFHDISPWPNNKIYNLFPTINGHSSWFFFSPTTRKKNWIARAVRVTRHIKYLKKAAGWVK